MNLVALAEELMKLMDEGLGEDGGGGGMQKRPHELIEREREPYLKRYIYV